MWFSPSFPFRASTNSRLQSTKSYIRMMTGKLRQSEEYKEGEASMEPITVCCISTCVVRSSFQASIPFHQYCQYVCLSKDGDRCLLKLGTGFRTKSMISFSNNARSAQYGRDTYFWLPAANTMVIRDVGERMRSDRAGVKEGGFT